MTTAPIVPAPDEPLTQRHYQELALANDRAKTIRRAAGVAAFNGWTIGVLAVLSAPFAYFGWAGLFVTVGLAVVAYIEFRGRKGLLKFDPSAASLLGWNQVGFLAMIVVYCLWMLYAGLHGADQFAAEVESVPELAGMLGTAGKDLYKTLVVGLYSTVIVLSAIFQGGNAIYYFTRRKHIAAYVEQTPKWVLDFQRANTTA